MSPTPRRRRSVDSLKTMAMERIIKNPSFYQKSEFEALPIPIKNQLLKKLTATGRTLKNVEINELLGALINKHTTQINMTPFRVTDSLLEKLSVCENMQTVIWFQDSIGYEFTSAGLISFLERARELTFLMLVKSDEVNDEVLKSISHNCRRLEVLEIAGSRNVTDEGLTHLSSTKLSTLSISETNTITDKGLIALAQGKINETLKEVVVSHCGKVTHLGLKMIAKNCPNLSSFNITSNANVDAADVHDILQDLRLSLNQVFYDLVF